MEVTQEKEGLFKVIKGSILLRINLILKKSTIMINVIQKEKGGDPVMYQSSFPIECFSKNIGRYSKINKIEEIYTVLINNIKRKEFNFSLPDKNLIILTFLQGKGSSAVKISLKVKSLDQFEDKITYLSSLFFQLGQKISFFEKEMKYVFESLDQMKKRSFMLSTKGDTTISQLDFQKDFDVFRENSKLIDENQKLIKDNEEYVRENEKLKKENNDLKQGIAKILKENALQLKNIKSSIETEAKLNYQGLRGDLLRENDITTSLAEKISISKWISKNKQINTVLLYKATDDGDNIKTFHELCDNKGPTLVLIKTTKECRFGGFTGESWDKTDKFKKDNDTFIFSLDQNEKYRIRNSSEAICCYKNKGPCFGVGHDICICDGFLGNLSSYSDTPHTFKVKTYYGLCKGEKFFQVKELEVYQITFLD